MFNGIDLSHNNGAVDWQQVKAGGQVEFAILRAGFGWDNDKQVDKQFAANVEGCQRVGIPFGIYHYSYAANAEEARKEAQWLLKVIQGLKPEYPVFWDFERPEQIGGQGYKGLSLSVQMEMIEAWMEELEGAGYFAGLYSTASALQRLQTAYPDRLGKYLLWVAHVNVDKPLVQSGIWQYSWKGRIPGIQGEVDLNHAYQDFPTIIRGAGLNGWTRADEPPAEEQAPVEQPLPVVSISLEELEEMLRRQGIKNIIL